LKAQGVLFRTGCFTARVTSERLKPELRAIIFQKKTVVSQLISECPVCHADRDIYYHFMRDHLITPWSRVLDKVTGW